MSGIYILSKRHRFRAARCMACDWVSNRVATIMLVDHDKEPRSLLICSQCLIEANRIACEGKKATP
jgi:hypothetical protein